MVKYGTMQNIVLFIFISMMFDSKITIIVYLQLTYFLIKKLLLLNNHLILSFE